jgi:hypothetical protein
MISTTAIDVNASPELVFRLAADVERWPDLLPHYASARLERIARDGSRVVRFAARREFVPWLGLGLPLAWRAATSNDPETLTLRFVHLGGATAGMEVTWRIEPRAGGSHVEIEHRFRPRLEIWARLVDRLLIGPVAGRTLAAFRSIAEAATAAEANAAEADRGREPIGGVRA